jgi:hypothetical protein
MVLDQVVRWVRNRLEMPALAEGPAEGVAEGTDGK